MTKKTDPVNYPAHYTKQKIDWRDVADDWELSWRLTHALKYLCRHRHKGNPVQDLQKMVRYAEMEIERLMRSNGKISIEKI